MRRLRLDHEQAEVQREIDQLQRQDHGRNFGEIDRLFQRKLALLRLMEELT
jgi:hypothetical protein